MKKLLTLVVLLMTTISFGQNIITEWDFESSTTTPVTGIGTITLLGGVVENGTIPYVTGNPGKAYTTKTYATQSTGSGTTGIQFQVNTNGQSNINIYVDVYGSNTASKYVQLQYTLDGSNWTNSGQPTIVPYGTSSSQWVTLTAAIPSSSSSFAFRVVSVFDPTTGNTSYSAVNPNINTTTTLAYAYAVTGALRFDNVKVSNGVLSTNQNNKMGLIVYPNPVKNGLLNIQTTNNSVKNVVVYDLLGKQVLSTLTSNTVNVSSLNSGIYTMKIIEEDNTGIMKIVIN